MNKRLFTDTEHYVPEANQISIEFRQAIGDLLDKYSKEYSVRDLHYLLSTELDITMLGQVLRKQYALTKAKKSQG